MGKTTILRELEKEAKGAGFQTAFLDFEQPMALAEFNRSPQEIISRMKSLGQVVLIDELQYLPNASKILKAVFDSGAGVKFICSGSSSLEIHKHLKESLAGRRLLFRIYPLQYSELKAHRGNFALNHYLRYGGMPGLALVDDEARKRELLSEFLSAYILKDIKSLVKEENIRAFNHLLYLLAGRQGSVISIHSLANEVGLSTKAVSRYCDLLEETFVNFRVFSYSQNLGNELKKSCKCYLYDLGIRNALLKDFSPLESRPDKGAILETFVFLRLQSGLAPNEEIKFWRTKDGDEVDFIFLRDRKPFPIEVKGRLASLEIPKGMKRFLSRYPRTRSALVLSENLTGTVHQEETLVRFATLESFDRGEGGLSNLLASAA